MPKAISQPIPSRRVFLGATTIGLLAGAPIAALAAMPAEHPDAELLAACAAFQACQARMDVLNETGCDDEAMNREGAAWDVALGSVASFKAHTLEGLRAQADAAITALRIHVGVSQYQPWEELADPEDELVMAVLARVAGRA